MNRTEHNVLSAMRKHQNLAVQAFQLAAGEYEKFAADAHATAKQLRENPDFVASSRGASSEQQGRGFDRIAQQFMLQAAQARELAEIVVAMQRDG